MKHKNGRQIPYQHPFVGILPSIFGSLVHIVASHLLGSRYIVQTLGNSLQVLDRELQVQEGLGRLRVVVYVFAAYVVYNAALEIPADRVFSNWVLIHFLLKHLEKQAAELLDVLLLA